MATHKLQIADIRRETADTVSVLLDVPEALKAEFSYQQGQYITFIKEIDNQELRRSYSVCEAPSSGDLRVAIKQIPNGLFSTYANQTMQVGDWIEVMTPMGNFIAKADGNADSRYVFFAAGSGITPIISNIKALLEIEDQSKIVLLYGNKTADSIIFKEQIEDLKNQYIGRFEIYHILSRDKDLPTAFQGRIDVDKCKHFDAISPLTSAQGYYLCGPEEMILSVSEWLQQAGVEKSKIHFELFSTGKKAQAEAEESKAQLEEGKAQVSVIVDGVTVEFELDKNGENILDAALEAGADVPFACKGGVCCTCRAKVMEGEVNMDVNYALQEEEVEEGFVLTCQSHPVTDKVLINFDEL
ncbi:MAG: 2Fe-2S iron-sulfur cluster-binding protein [Flavobacteriales bacterium]